MQRTSIDDSVPDDDSDLHRDQAERRYYYDDAHGYEDFDAEKECDDEESDD